MRLPLAGDVLRAVLDVANVGEYLIRRTMDRDGPLDLDHGLTYSRRAPERDRSQDMDSKEPEYEKHAAQPRTGAAGDNQDWHAVFHVVTCAVRTSSCQALEQRDQERENSQPNQRPEPNQRESPERL